MTEEENGGMEEDGREFDGTGTFHPFSDTDTTTLFQDLEHELEKMVQKYHVPPTDLESLFQVVQNLFEMMDTSRETYESLAEQKTELEDLWKMEKDKSRVAQRRKLELECRLEEEKSRLEHEKSCVERDKASLQTKLRQSIEHKSYVEQELLRLKDKTVKDDQTRKDLLDQYKKQYDRARQHSLKRAASVRSHRRLPVAPHSWDTAGPGGGFRPAERIQRTPDSFQSSEDSFPHSITSATGSGVSEPPSLSTTQISASSALPTPNTVPLYAEIEKEEKEKAEQTESDQTESELVNRALGESFEEMPLGMQPPPPPAMMSSSGEDTESEEEGALIAPGNRGLSLEDELGPELLAPARAELEMLQKEKENWEREKERLEKERGNARSGKEDVESQCAQLQVELQRLKEKQNEVQEELQDVRKERDEVLEMYLDQPFDDYCITRKELLDLLRRHHNTAIELEKEKEEKQRLQNLLDARKSFFVRFKQSMRRMFNRYPRPSTSSGSSDRGRSFTPSDDQFLEASLSEVSPPPVPLPPLTKTIAQSMDVITKSGWLAFRDSGVCLDQLPTWIGQITLSGIETERVECAAVGRIYSSEDTLGVQVTPPRSRHSRRLSPAHHTGVQQLHAEVWVATTEGSTSFIEIVDILSRTAKVRQRFVLRPRAAHIVCMKAMPGNVEESSEFTDSALISVDTSWVEDAFSPLMIHRSYSDSKAASWRRGSTSDLVNAALLSDGPRGTQFTQSLCIPRDSYGAGQKASGASAVGEVTGSPGTVRRRLDFSPQRENGKTAADRLGSISKPVLDRDATFSPDHHPLSQSLSGSIRNQDTILEERTSLRAEPVSDMFDGREGIDSPGSVPLPPSAEGVWMGMGGGGNGEGGRSEEVRRRRRRTSSVRKMVMWVITEDNRLVFYPTTDPSHIPINSVTLQARALCIEHIKGKIYIGHAESEISIFHPDEFMQDTWDIQNPTKLSLPSYDATVCYDVKCIASVGSELWVGAGPSIFFLDEQSLERRGSKFIDNWHDRPEQILPVGDLVLVATKGSALYIFDRQQHDVMRKFDVTPVMLLLESPKRSSAGKFVSPTAIKCLATDNEHVYVGTSNGQIVTIPIDKLSQKRALPSPPHPDTSSPLQQASASDLNGTDGDAKGIPADGIPPRKPPRKGRRSKGTQTVDKSKKSVRARSSESPFFGGSEENDSSEHDEVNGVFLEQSAVSLHSHKNDKVRTLLHVSLPRSQRDLPSQPGGGGGGGGGRSGGGGGGNCFNSMPNLSGAGHRLPLGQPLFKSLVVSIGKGHVEYSTLPPEPEQNLEDASARRERNKAFQLMLWGHRNSIP